MEREVHLHKMTEEYIDMIQSLVHIEDKHLFRAMLMFYYGSIASTQGATVVSENFGEIPLNFYTNVLAPSGFGKNVTIGMIENYIWKPFYESFQENTFPMAKEKRFAELYPIYEKQMTNAKSVTPPSSEEVYKAMEEEYYLLGGFVPFFEEITPAAIRQLTNHIKMTGSGALGLVVDEIGSSLQEIKPALGAFLKLYDVGETKTKVLKNYKDSARVTEIDKPAPANMMLFGEPNMLLNGAEMQQIYMALLLTGFARRVIFACVETKPPIQFTPEELYERASKSRSKFSNTDYWAEMGKEDWYGKQIILGKEEALEILAYNVECSQLAATFQSHEGMKATELEHRYFRVLKMAGLLAFVDRVDRVTSEHIKIAISIAEESGKHFHKILNRPDSYQLVLKYLEENEGLRITKAELYKNVPCFKGSQANQNNLLDLAIAEGVSNNTVVSKSNANGVEYYTAMVLEETDINKLVVSGSTHEADGYAPMLTSYEKLKNFCLTDGYAWSNHHFLNQHRNKANVIEGFNIVILDIDGTSTIDVVSGALRHFKHFIYTTKSHKPEEHHFRVVIPLSHKVKLTPEKFSEFMMNVFDFMPFTVDEVTKDASRMWYTNSGELFEPALKEFDYRGEEIDVEQTLLPATWFIPDSRDSETMIKDLARFSNSNIVRYFHKTSKYGVRNNNLYRYARFLMDAGYEVFEDVIKKVQELNKTLDHPLSDEELSNTVFKSISRMFDK